MRKEITHAEFIELVKAQGHKDSFDATFVCPACMTLQTGNQLMTAMGTSDREEANSYLGYSCIGRFNNEQSGCDWTLGGLFQIHELEVLVEDNGETKAIPTFEPKTKEELSADINTWQTEARTIKDKLDSIADEDDRNLNERRMEYLLDRVNKAVSNNLIGNINER